MKRIFFLLTTLLCCGMSTFSQEVRSSSSQYLPAYPKPDVNISYSLSAEGKRFTPTWGLDQAWISEQNLLKGINHMGKDNIGIGRSAFRYSVALTNDSVLGTDDINALRRRNTVFDKLSTTLPLILTADQEAVGPTAEEPDRCPPEYFVKNRSANVEHWAAMINSHVHWLQANTKHPVVGISPFNEPDYWTLEEGATTTKQWQVAKMLKEKYPRCADIPMVGGNTLNNDKALEWYSSGKQYYDWGNTHQLAGSFDTFAGFYQQLTTDGKVGYADEMHNVGEAMVGLEYGMTVGIWWGFDSRARGEFCQISRNGVRLAYGEHRNNWTAASVYRHDDGRVKAFVGSSERQAATTKYQFVSADHDVYYDGYGPVREFVMEIPGGTGYQKGQTNAERVIDVTWGEDVAPSVINGTYKIVNKATGNVLAVSGNLILQQKDKNTNTQQWTVIPVPKTIGGDYSYYNLESVSNPMIHINVKDFSTSANAEIIAYKLNTVPSSNEQWHMEYADGGYYYIRNRESALYLASKSASNFSGVGVTQKEMQSGSSRDLILWRLLPTTVNYETTAPTNPKGLETVSHPTSVTLIWDENTDKDLNGYLVFRAPKGTTEWNTIARNLKTNYFTDNTCRQGQTYIYKVKAIDAALNVSASSEVVEAGPTGVPSLVARWSMDETLYDDTPNLMDVVCSTDPVYVDCPSTETKGISLASERYLQLPYGVANSEELTIGMWVNWRSTGTWQRIFDFGIDTEHYMFLTPSTGSVMRFAIKNGEGEQTVDCKTKLSTNVWKHVVVTIAKGKTTIYIDGVVAASSSSITICPTDFLPVMNYLGRSQFISDPYFIGYLDDVRIYNYAVDAEEVQAMMNGELPTSIKSDVVTEKEVPVVYGLDGIKRKVPRPGMNIINGKKVVKH
jgi:hypothetical protein